MMSGNLDPKTIAILAFSAFVIACIVGYYVFGHGKKRREVLKLRQHSRENQLRQSDTTQLDPDKEKDRIKANKLIEQGKVIEGARLLENISLHRFAISALEHAGEIDAACAVLLRMDRPNRAGVVYARNKMFVKAAEHFKIAKMYQDAGEAYVQAAQAKPEYHSEAAKMFIKSEDFDAAIRSYLAVGMTKKVVALCSELERWTALRDLLSRPDSAQAGFEFIDAKQCKRLILGIPADETSVKSIALWLKVTKRVELAMYTLTRFQSDVSLCALFWAELDENLGSKIVKKMVDSNQLKTPEGKKLLSVNAHACYLAKRIKQSESLYIAVGRFAMAAKCAALLGDLSIVAELLRSAHGEEILLERVETILEQNQSEFSEGSWGESAIIAVNEALTSVDPEADSQRSQSPFSMSA